MSHPDTSRPTDPHPEPIVTGSAAWQGAAPVGRTAGVERDRATGGVDGGGGMGTGWAVALAAGAAAGAWLAVPVPVVVAVPPALLGLVLRLPVLVVVGVALLAAGMGARAVTGLAPVTAGSFEGTVELVTDPEPSGPVGQRAEVRLPDGRRVRATAHGPAAWALADAHAGSRVPVSGRLRPLAHRSAWTDSRHLVGGLALDRVGPHRHGSALSRLAQVVRSAVDGGAAHVPEAVRPLYTGLVVGDDRLQPPAQQAAFRAAGLTHLLAVSGQNVAFVLLVAGPVLRRLSTWPRFAAVGAVLVVFATVTRYEPSVLRATATAGIAAWSVALGRPNRGLRVLALAVAGLVLIDPLLVRSVGFQLSVAASAGILALGPWLGDLVPGPRWVREPLVVTLAAQLAVLPLLAGVFGPVSVVSVPANLLVAGASGLVMTWGLSAGVVAGALPDAVAVVVQAPATWSLRWIDSVARTAASVPAPRLGPAAIVPLGIGLAWCRWSATRRWLGVVLVTAVLVTAPLSDVAGGDLPGARWCPGGDGAWGVLVLEQPGRTPALLEALLDRGVRQVDVVVVTGGGRTYARAVGELRSLLVVGPVLAPPGHQVPGARRLTEPVALARPAGGLVVEPVDGDTVRVAGPC